MRTPSSWKKKLLTDLTKSAVWLKWYSKPDQVKMNTDKNFHTLLERCAWISRNLFVISLQEYYNRSRWRATDMDGLPNGKLDNKRLEDGIGLLISYIISFPHRVRMTQQKREEQRGNFPAHLVITAFVWWHVKLVSLTVSFGHMVWLTGRSALQNLIWRPSIWTQTRLCRRCL